MEVKNALGLTSTAHLKTVHPAANLVPSITGPMNMVYILVYRDAVVKATNQSMLAPYSIHRLQFSLRVYLIIYRYKLQGYGVYQVTATSSLLAVSSKEQQTQRAVGQ